MDIVLPKRIQQQIFAHMEATYPHECGGFLLGHDGESVRIAEIVPVENVFEESERHHRYAMTPEDWMRMEDKADERGLKIVGYYHSHPDSPAIPSEYDREYALPNFVYVITSVVAAKAVAMHAWHLRDDRSQFDSKPLVILDDDGLESAP